MVALNAQAAPSRAASRIHTLPPQGVEGDSPPQSDEGRNHDSPSLVAGPDELGESVLQVHACGNLLGGARGYDSAAADNGHMGAEALHGRHHVAGDDDGAATGGEIRQDRLDRLGRYRIHSLEGLVQDEDTGRVDQRTGEVDLLAHAGGVIGDEGASGTIEVQDMEELGRTGDDDVTLETAQQPGIRDQFQPGQAVESAQAIGQNTELRLWRRSAGPIRRCHGRSRGRRREAAVLSPLTGSWSCPPHWDRQRRRWSRPERPERAC